MTTTKDKKKTVKDKFTKAASGVKLLGTILTWDMGGVQHKHSDVVKALKDNSFDERVAREILPRHAFTRACKKLEDERVIDQFKEDDDSITFQFTKKESDQTGVTYTKETFLVLDKTNGKVTCPVYPLQEKAQAEIDRAMEYRTTGDITRIVMRLFESNADLFPIRDRGGVYFAPDEHHTFVDMIGCFIGGLGGKLSKFPVPAGAGGEKSVADTVADGIASLIKEREDAVEKFNTHTRGDTLAEAAKKIAETKLKVEAYAHYLDERKEELLEALKKSEKDLDRKIGGIREELDNAPVVVADGTRERVFGHPVTSVIRWMGSVGWRWEEVKGVIDGVATSPVSENTAKTQVSRARTDPSKYKPAELTTKQQLYLENERKKFLKKEGI